MADRYQQAPAIFLADRGYESFNVFAHLLQNGHKFIIRMKDIHSNGILSGRGLPDQEFDGYLETTLTKRHTKETLGSPAIFTILPATTDFDYLNEECRYFKIRFRIVRFRLGDGSFMCVASNLPEGEFPLNEIKYLYHLRWGQETGFRELKYTVGLLDFHSRKKDFIIQEIYARMILYNFCELAAGHAAVTKKGGAKYSYKINFATAVNICRAYLKSGGDETEMLLLIQRHLTPIRPGRKYPLNLRAKRNRDFIYRAA